jgi:ABC-type uncharacterized transport system YnjBCD ATPase subunit
MMFEGDDALKRISVLSGGEKSRVLLSRLIATPANLLLLDGPTNHLDLESNDALREALDAFRDLGARRFIPTQWGTFQLGDEPVGHAPTALSEAVKTTGVDPARITILKIGQLLPMEAGSPGRVKYRKP